jgi:protein farnesyltransferase subunit beta
MSRQMRVEGGFQGRPNKLVDSCYSFWVGALFPLIHITLTQSKLSPSIATNNNNNNTKDETKISLLSNEWCFDQIALQKYILLCCQDKNGGLKDKPEKYVEFKEQTKYNTL